MSHSSGVIYKPIDVISDVATVLGRNTGDIGRLCSDTDNNGVDQNIIKFWSLKRPIRHSFVGELTDAQWKAANYGYTIASYTKPVGEAQTGLIYGHINNQSWQYLKPRGASHNEWFRLLDFDGYNHAATNPFEISYEATPVQGNNSRIYLDFLDEFLTWGLFSSFAPTYTSLHLGLIAYSASVSNPQSCYLLPVTSSQSGQTLLDIAGQGFFNFPVSSNVFSVGSSYKLRPILMTYNAGSNYGSWMSVSAQSATNFGTMYDILCPEITIVPAQQVTPDQNVTINVDEEGAVYSGDSPMNITSVPFYISNSNGSAITSCTLYVYFKDYTYSSQGQTVELGHLSSFTINANASNVLKTVSGNINITPMTSRAQGSYELTFRYNNQTYTKTGTFYIGER